jgi:VWFA-related protein
MPRTLAILVACSLLVVSTARARQAAPSQTPFRSGVEGTTIEVSVVDDTGAPIPDLAAADFAVTVDGRTRRVVSARFVRMALGEPARDASPPVPVSSNEDTGRGRLLVFVLDQLTLTQSSIRLVSRAASRMVAHLTPSDRSALVAIPIGDGVPFTADHARVLEAMERTMGGPAASPESRRMGLEEVRAVAAGDSGSLERIASRECPGQTLAGRQAGGSRGGGSRLGSGRGIGVDDNPANADNCRRRLELDAKTIWQQLYGTSLSSMASLRSVLAELRKVPGEKTVILVSGGWPLQVRDASSDLAPLAAVANEAHATLHALFAAGADTSADRGTMSLSPVADQAVRRWPLETLAGLTGGVSFRVDAGAPMVFERLARELSGFYRVAVEQASPDADGRPRPLKVHVARRGALVRAPGRLPLSSYSARDAAARLDAALGAPLPSTGLGVRLASYVVASPDESAAAKVLLVGDAFGLRPGPVSLQVLLQEISGRVVSSAIHEVGTAVSDRVPFTTSVAVEPGRYIVRAAVIDDSGNVGSVDHAIDVRARAVGTLTAGELVLARVPTGGLVLDAVRQGERLAMQIDLSGDPERVGAADVLFEVATRGDEPALLSVEATRAQGRSGGTANAIASLAALPPGLYVARAKVTVDDTVVTVRRPFVLADASLADPPRSPDR